MFYGNTCFLRVLMIELSIAFDANGFKRLVTGNWLYNLGEYGLVTLFLCLI